MMKHFVAKQPADLCKQVQKLGLSLGQVSMVPVGSRLWCFYDAKDAKQEAKEEKKAELSPVKPEVKAEAKEEKLDKANPKLGSK